MGKESENASDSPPEGAKDGPEEPPRADGPEPGPQSQGQQHRQTGVPPADGEGQLDTAQGQQNYENAVRGGSRPPAGRAQKVIGRPQGRPQQGRAQELTGGVYGGHHPNSRRAQPPRGSS